MIKRRDPETAARVFERAYADPTSRAAVFLALAESARKAHELSPGGWGLTLFENGARLNMGMVNAVIARGHDVGLLVPAEPNEDDGYANAPDARIEWVPLERLERSYTALRPRHHRALASVRAAGYTWKQAHSPGLLRHLERMTGMVLADPDYERGDAVDPEPAGARDAETVTVRFEEGATLERRHKTIERNRDLVQAAKAVWMQRDPELHCSVCKFSFVERYGQRGESFIEAHHVTPLSDLGGVSRMNSAAELAPVCSNCHRMLHREPPASLDELRTMLVADD
jgi:hypothetical protein